MTLDVKALGGEGVVKDTEFTRGLLERQVKKEVPRQSSMLSEALRRADILKNMQGCSSCKARLENPHADYHLTAVIDSSKI